MNQPMGLNEWATNLVKGEQVLAYTERAVRTYPDGREEVIPPHGVFTSSVIKSPTGKAYHGYFDEDFPLSAYNFPDGKTYTEFVQAAPCSSGPVIFFALMDEKGNWVPESLWPDEEIDNA